jgi:hypothetical protein
LSDFRAEVAARGLDTDIQDLARGEEFVFQVSDLTG